MAKNVVILVDGQNLYYNLNEINIKEREISWEKLFKSFIDDGDELVRAYWFRPAKILDTFFSEERIRNNIIYKYYRTHIENFKNGSHSEIPTKIKADVEAKTEKAVSWIKAQKEKFSNIEYAYDQLCLENEDIEVVKSGVLKIDPFNQIYLGEKGVDISLAVKMIALSVQKKCDKIILISGDFDYSEAIKFVKDNMTKIHIVKMHKGYPPKSKSMSRDLSVLADRVIDVYEEEIRKNYLK